MPVATGRRTAAAAAYQGYVVWKRRGLPNHPRIEISPDQVISPNKTAKGREFVEAILHTGDF